MWGTPDSTPEWQPRAGRGESATAVMLQAAIPAASKPALCVATPWGGASSSGPDGIPCHRQVAACLTGCWPTCVLHLQSLVRQQVDHPLHSLAAQRPLGVKSQVKASPAVRQGCQLSSTRSGSTLRRPG